VFDVCVWCLCADCRVGLCRFPCHAEASVATRSDLCLWVCLTASPRCIICECADDGCSCLVLCRMLKWREHHIGHTPCRCQRAGTGHTAPCLPVAGSLKGCWVISGVYALCAVSPFAMVCFCVCLGGRNRRGHGDDLWRCGCGVDWAPGGMAPACMVWMMFVFGVWLMVFAF
jgi:hypothetical protein